MDLLKSIFSMEDVENIRQIPLTNYNRLDKMIWRGTANGVFILRSSYYMQGDLYQRKKSQCSQSTEHCQDWTRIWRLGIPTATKNFLCRACLDSLPTKVNLCKRKILDDQICPMCLVELETTEHIIWECIFAYDILGQSSRNIKKIKASYKSIKTLLVEIFKKLDKNEMEELGLVLWNLWWRRNKYVF